MKRQLFFFLIALLCSWNVQKAQGDDTVPQRIQGNWAHPDCGHDKEAVIFTRYFYLKSVKNEISLLPVHRITENAEYWVLKIDNAERPYRVEEDGILKTGQPAKDSPKKPKIWDELILENKEEFTGCMETPDIVPKTLARLMRYIDRIRDQCTLSITNDCARVLFKLADADNNQKISQAEIKRGFVSALLLAGLAEKKTLHDKDSKDIAALAKAEGQKISDDLFARYDSDKSKTLDYNELMTDFSAPRFPIVKPTLEKIGLLLPSFKIVAMSLK